VLLVLALGLGALFTRLPLGRAAAVVAAVVLAVALADYRLFAGPGLDVPPTAGLALAPLVWVGIEGLRRLVSERQARERERELAVARTIQQRLLPSKPPDLPGLDIHGVNVPAEAVGGDYFDWVPVGEHQLAVVLGDVSGHGVPAALLMSHLRASFHAEARDGASASEIVHAVHRSLSRAVESGRFATFFLALIDRQGPALAYCNAGHNPPLVAREAGVEELPATGIPLAMIEMLGYTEGRAALAPGDTLLVFSDGVPEWPRGDDFYGDERMRERFLALVAEGRDARGIVEGLLADVRAWARGSVNVDDVTLVVVRRT
jgi:sigma-B regulation protein RsbU (phosphoserine phosphatase)